MKKIFVAICILALLAMVGWKITSGMRKSNSAKDLLSRSSDVGQVDRTVRILGDDWLGYCVFRSRIFQDALLKDKIGVDFKDEFDFQKRFNALAKGDCDMVVATVDSFLVNARETNYPGVITFLIDESFGGDALVASQNIKSLDDLRGENVTGSLVGFSPSEFLLKSQIAHFNLDALSPKISSFRADTPTDAYQELATGKADFAVLWEPFTSKALAEIPGAHKLIDTSQARNIILDVAIASRELVTREPEVAAAVTRAYFETLAHYLNKPEEFKELAQAYSGKSAEEAARMLAGIKFTTFQSNVSEWFPVTPPNKERLRDGIEDISQILQDVGDLKGDPLNGNARALINSKFLSDLQNDPAIASGLTRGAAGFAGGATTFFKPLDELGWNKVRDNFTGTLMEEPVTFRSGSSDIPDEFQEMLRIAARNLVHYPEHRLVVQAHVSPGSDPEIDRQLSTERATAISDFLVNECAIDRPRILSEGKGSDEQIQRKQGESQAAWKRRLRRARIYIGTEG